jgi:hypothetical protein
MGMSMSLSIMPRLYQTQALECRCCRQIIDDQRQQSGRLGFMLYGAVAYGICILCHQEVPETSRDRNYKVRYRRAARRLLASRTASPQEGNTCGELSQHAEHHRDEDCTLVDGVCSVCGVHHGDACECGGRGFHREGCKQAVIPNCPSCGNPCEGVRGEGYVCWCGGSCEHMH